jgi:hypothetical protein
MEVVKGDDRNGSEVDQSYEKTAIYITKNYGSFLTFFFLGSAYTKQSYSRFSRGEKVS